MDIGPVVSLTVLSGVGNADSSAGTRWNVGSVDCGCVWVAGEQPATTELNSIYKYVSYIQNYIVAIHVVLTIISPWTFQN